MRFRSLGIVSVSALLPLVNCGILDAAKQQESHTIRNLESGQPQTIVAYGTSLTAEGAWVSQLGTALEERYYGLATIINSGQSGMNSEWGLKNVISRVVSKQPDCAFIEFSINDVVSKAVTVEVSKRNLNDIIDTILHYYPECEIVLMTMNPRTNGSEILAGTAEYYDVYREVATDRQLVICDNFASWIDLESRDKGLYDIYVPDGCHPTARGNMAIVTPNILNTLGLGN